MGLGILKHNSNGVSFCLHSAGAGSRYCEVRMYGYSQNWHGTWTISNSSPTNNRLWGGRAQDSPLWVVVVVCLFDFQNRSPCNPETQLPRPGWTQTCRILMLWLPSPGITGPSPHGGLPFEIFFFFVELSSPIRISYHTVKPLTASLLHKSKARPHQSTGNSQNSFQLDFHLIYSQHVTSGL